MRRLKFQPQPQIGTNYLSCAPNHESVNNNSEKQYSAIQRIDKAIASMMKKSESHLEYFRSIECDCPIR